MTITNPHPPSPSLRHRKNSATKVSTTKKVDTTSNVDSTDKGFSDTDVSKHARIEEVVWGKTPGGEGMRSTP